MQAASAMSVMAVAVMLSGCTASPAAHGAPLHAQNVSWAMYQHSPDRNAVFDAYVIPRDWSYEAKASINGGLALTGTTLLFTTFAHKLVAIDVRDGHELWHAQLGNIAMTTPIVAGNSVFVGTGKNGVLKRNLMQRVRFYREEIWGVPEGDDVAAFDLRTGAPQWKFHTVGEDMPSAVYDRGRLIFANGDWHAYALRADNGKPIWSTDVGGVSTMANALVAGNIVVIAICPVGMRDTEAVALDPSNGKILWRAPWGHCDGSPAYGDGKIFAESVTNGDSTLQKKTDVAALDVKTGKPVWIRRGAVQGLWSIVGSDEVAVAGTYASGTYYQPEPLQDQLVAFDAKNGNIRWTFHTSGPAKMSPVVKKGRVYFGDTVGMFYTLDARNGKLLEIREFKQPFTVSPPIILGNRIVVVNGTSVHAIPLAGRPHLPTERVGYGATPAMRQEAMEPQAQETEQ